MICCAHCDYKTNRHYNLKRHEISKHFDTIYNESEENVLNTDSTNINNDSTNMNRNSININHNSINMNKLSVNMNHDFKDEYCELTNTYNCKDCYKTFKNIYNLKNHKPVCKKIKNPLECSFCHHIYACTESLCKHKKTCKSKALIISEKDEENAKSIISNSIVNSTVNNNSNNTQNNYTVNIFPADIEAPFTLYTDHIDSTKLRKEIEVKNVKQCLALSLRLLMQNKDNLPVRKTNMRSKYSYVHLGGNKWSLRNDNEIYSLLSYHISHCFKIYLKNNNVVKLEKYYNYLSKIFEHIMYESLNEDEKDMVTKAKHFMNILILEAYKNNSKKEN
jgi:hypothetical protein